MTLYRGPEAEKAMIAGMLVVYEYRDLVMDMMATFLGYMSWRQYKDFNSQEINTWNNLQLKYEILYYIWRTGLDLKKKDKLVHHLMCLGYLYFGWPFKTALSTAFYFASISNCFLAITQKHPNNVTKISFAMSFVVYRIIYGTWIMKGVAKLPVKGSETLIIPMTGTVYALQWMWLRKIALKASKALYSNGGGVVK
ncbi:hypothetical protein [Yellowstone lake phycodnavirus 2]|jgi:hypothetical protein|uniref:hypothetical protein n=1 Tax=Yellowstone lake phycodnavirus 2 TaxID=1586714 RepID=UPI0006EBA08A|nr:hypothetical protein AR678_gp066 [Yellowstone lake phycodnavirus 2]BAT22340.1 hypothetical protein [Yellowstone lake phycodnavirus 2]